MSGRISFKILNSAIVTKWGEDHALNLAISGYEMTQRDITLHFKPYRNQLAVLDILSLLREDEICLVIVEGPNEARLDDLVLTDYVMKLNDGVNEGAITFDRFSAEREFQARYLLSGRYPGK